MSRSYHVTEKQTRVAFSQGDVEPVYQVSEKAWVKKQQKQAREMGATTANRVIVAGERVRTQRAKKAKQSGGDEAK